MPRTQTQRTDGMTATYPDEWSEIAGFIKHHARGRCIRCHHEHDPAGGFTLTVHHLDMYKPNVQPWNLPALCQRCHLRIQGRVDFEQQYMFGHSEWLAPFLDLWRCTRKEFHLPARTLKPLGIAWRKAVVTLYRQLHHPVCECGDWSQHNVNREVWIE